MGGGEEAGVIDYNGHFCAVVARLIEDSLLELYEYIWILFKSRIQVQNMVFNVVAEGGYRSPRPPSSIPVKNSRIKVQLSTTREEDQVRLWSKGSPS